MYKLNPFMSRLNCLDAMITGLVNIINKAKLQSESVK